MERNSKIIGCPLSIEQQEALGINEDSIFDAWYDNGQILIRVVDESEVESVDLNEQSESNRDEYIAGYNDGHIEGYKEGFREGFNDGYISKCGICQRNPSYNE